MLALSERGRRETTGEEIVELLGAGVKAADHVIESRGVRGCPSDRVGSRTGFDSNGKPSSKMTLDFPNLADFAGIESIGLYLYGIYCL